MIDRRCRRGLAVVLTTVLILSASAQNVLALSSKSDDGFFSRVLEMNETFFDKAKGTDLLLMFDRLTSKIDKLISKNENSISFTVINMPQSDNNSGVHDGFTAVGSQTVAYQDDIAANNDTTSGYDPAGSHQEVSRSCGIPFEEEDVALLAKIIYAEARGESFEGQVAVGAVVINRVESPKFPDTIEDVIYQQGQFSAVSDRQIELTPDEVAYQAALTAIEGQDPTNGAVFYYNPMIATDNWIKTRDVVRSIGNHKFCV